MLCQSIKYRRNKDSTLLVTGGFFVVRKLSKISSPKQIYLWNMPCSGAGNCRLTGVLFSKLEQKIVQKSTQSRYQIQPIPFYQESDNNS